MEPWLPSLLTPHHVAHRWDRATDSPLAHKCSSCSLPPPPSIELRRVKHADTESDTKSVSVRGNDLGRASTEGNRTQSVSPNARKLLEIQYGCLCLALFLAGWNDRTNGPLIPRIRRYYNVSPIVASFLLLHSYPITRRSISPSSPSSSSPTAW